MSVDNDSKPSYTFQDEMGKALENLSRHARGVAHAVKTIDRLRESDQRGSEPPGSHPEDTSAATSERSSDVDGLSP